MEKLTKRKLSKLYDNDHEAFTKLAGLTKFQVEAISWSMYFWRNNHCDRYRCANYTQEQYKKAYKKTVMFYACHNLKINK